MRTWMSVLLAAVIVFLGLSAISATARQRELWEYQFHETDSIGTLNKAGQDGWEVAAVYTPPGQSSSVRVLMKRRK